jgi:hypothetical protein
MIVSPLCANPHTETVLLWPSSVARHVPEATCHIFEGLLLGC